tara:strand:+ start:126 stop:236 length:111 start_codon:yes stop_codon:yes gene_type:complete
MRERRRRIKTKIPVAAASKAASAFIGGGCGRMMNIK